MRNISFNVRDVIICSVCSSCRELAVGRGSTAPVKNAVLPSIEDRPQWDGKDGKASNMDSCPE